MKVGVDLHVLQGINQGSKTYLDRIYSAASKMKGKDLEFYFYFSPDSPFDKKWSEFGSARTFNGRGRISRLIFDARRVQARDKLDCFHSQYIVPVRSRCDDIVTIHDILFETHPQYFSPAFVARSRLLVKRSARVSRRIFTVSNYCKDSIVNIYGIDPDKIVLTPNGVDIDEFQVDRVAAREYVRNSYGLDEYILTVGRLEPRKNHIGLLNAYALALRRNSSLPQLAIVGQRDFGFEGIFSLVQELGIENRVKFIENATFKDLVRLYRAASIFAYPSFAEGFGIPPLEAMAAGCPVICSETTSMSELYSNAAVLIDPSSIDSISDAILSLVESSELRDKLASESLVRARRFSWEAAAQNMLSGY